MKHFSCSLSVLKNIISNICASCAKVSQDVEHSLVKRSEEKKSECKEAEQIYVFSYLAYGLQGFVVPFMISDLPNIPLISVLRFHSSSGNVFLQDVKMKRA